jgi:large subunit ribosomal protein L19
MSQQLIREVSAQHQKNNIPKLKAGLTVRVYQKIKEGNKERIQIFEGLIISLKGTNGVSSTIIVRKIIDGYGVEKIFPVNSPNIDRIEVIKEAKVRKAKLYFMRERSGKSARLNERHLTKKDVKYAAAIAETAEKEEEVATTIEKEEEAATTIEKEEEAATTIEKEEEAATTIEKK